MSCHVCGQLARAPDSGRRTHRALRCPRCNAPMHHAQARQPVHHLGAGAAPILLFVPANLLPMMTTTSLLGSQEDTIMSGVVFLWQSGSWPLAAVVFFASVMVPLLKIIA
jgi:paraquat-inducible protein A